LCKRKYKAWLFYRISISNVPIMHRYNDNSQNACFLFCKIGTLICKTYGAAGIVQQALYRRLAVGVMGIAFLLNDYQIVPIYRTAARVSCVIKSL